MKRAVCIISVHYILLDPEKFDSIGNTTKTIREFWYRLLVCVDSDPWRKYVYLGPRYGDFMTQVVLTPVVQGSRMNRSAHRALTNKLDLLEYPYCYYFLRS